VGQSAAVRGRYNLLFIGLRRAFSPDRGRLSKIAAPIVATLSVAILALFIFVTFIESRRLPASRGAPQVGQKAPAFSLADTNGKTVSLSDLLASPINGKAPKGVLMIFYRGYW
jgi:AhpC/TSA family